MSPQSIDPGLFSPDVLEFLRQLNNHGVRFMIVGGEAVIFYGHIRLTGDVDVFFDRSPGNAARLFEALQKYWQGVIPGLDDPSQLEDSGVVFQLGIYPAYRKQDDEPTGRASESPSRPPNNPLADHQPKQGRAAIELLAKFEI